MPRPHRPRPGGLFIAIGDVSGKGVAAALFMARSMTSLRMEALRDLAPSAVLSEVNRLLCEGNDAGMFVSLFCGVLDTASGELVYSNGGHNPPATDASLGSGAADSQSHFQMCPCPAGWWSA